MDFNGKLRTANEVFRCPFYYYKNMNSQVDVLAKKIWDYHHMNQHLEKSDCILVLGSNDIRVADWAAQLFLDGQAPLIVFSGGNSNLTSEWTTTEADSFAERAVELGVPRDKILIENQSTNTGENIVFTRKLLTERHLNPKKIIVVQKPYMERRAYATFKKIWPEQQFVVTSPEIAFEDYPNEQLPKDLIINIIVGDLQRIKIYPAKGFQIYQEIPSDIWDAYEKLIALGYTKWLIAE